MNLENISKPFSFKLTDSESEFDGKIDQLHQTKAGKSKSSDDYDEIEGYKSLDSDLSSIFLNFLS